MQILSIQSLPVESADRVHSNTELSNSSTVKTNTDLEATLYWFFLNFILGKEGIFRPRFWRIFTSYNINYFTIFLTENLSEIKLIINKDKGLFT